MSSERICGELRGCVEFVHGMCEKVQGLIAQSGQEHLQQLLDLFQVGSFELIAL